MKSTIAPEPPETFTVHTETVGCDGGGGALGHPLVYLTVSKGDGTVECPYCDRKFILADDAHHHGH